MNLQTSVIQAVEGQAQDVVKHNDEDKRRKGVALEYTSYDVKERSFSIRCDNSGLGVLGCMQ